ncbi:MAG: hypothetical protein FD145_21 [Candidatus Saganbacteria bacterium]|uniref:O-antigen ligase-related domain-containing protein n=1 Tax=Candidatus Saganbacteria bacterium TaxID=2575572 RepID=A0A833NSP5_UNCSA|nr:MAG: hypothetical protein FD145_21 [Candidatus Saganbacteria bacterium]
MNIPFKFHAHSFFNFKGLNNLRIPISLTFLNYLAVFSVFTDVFTYYEYLRAPLIIMAIVLSLLILKTNKLYFNKTFLFLFCLASIITLISIKLGYASLSRFLLQFVGILFSAFGFYYLIKINNNDALKIFKIYMRIAFLIALIGVFQDISYLLHFQPGYNYRYLHPGFTFHAARMGLLRVSSILHEPTGLVFILMPAFFASLMSFFKGGFKFIKSWKALIIIMVFILTFSTTGYIGILFSLILVLISYHNIKYLFITFIIMTLFVYSAYNGVAEVKGRVDVAIKYFTGQVQITSLKGTAFASLSNAAISLMSFRDSPIFGFGLGSFENTYPRYMKNAIGVDIQKVNTGTIEMRLNYNDASSLFFRLLSETGLLGVLAYFIFIKRFYLFKDNDHSKYLWIINNGILCYFFLRLGRGGHYFNEGFFLFFWLYYFSKLNSKNPTRKVFYEK